MTNKHPEVEHLQALLAEKDKHINELMDTLSNFHVSSRSESDGNIIYAKIPYRMTNNVI